MNPSSGRFILRIQNCFPVGKISKPSEFQSNFAMHTRVFGSEWGWSPRGVDKFDKTKSLKWYFDAKNWPKINRKFLMWVHHIQLYLCWCCYKKTIKDYLQLVDTVTLKNFVRKKISYTSPKIEAKKFRMKKFSYTQCQFTNTYVSLLYLTLS